MGEAWRGRRSRTRSCLLLAACCLAACCLLLAAPTSCLDVNEADVHVSVAAGHQFFCHHTLARRAAAASTFVAPAADRPHGRGNRRCRTELGMWSCAIAHRAMAAAWRKHRRSGSWTDVDKDRGALRDVDGPRCALHMALHVATPQAKRSRSPALVEAAPG